MSDDWIDTIYDAVEKQRQKSGYVAKNDTINAQIACIKNTQIIKPFKIILIHQK